MGELAVTIDDLAQSFLKARKYLVSLSAPQRSARTGKSQHLRVAPNELSLNTGTLRNDGIFGVTVRLAKFIARDMSDIPLQMG